MKLTNSQYEEAVKFSTQTIYNLDQAIKIIELKYDILEKIKHGGITELDYENIVFLKQYKLID